MISWSKMGTTALFGALVALGPVAVGPGHAVESVRTVFERALPNAPGKRLVAVVVTYPPRSASPAHRHAPSAFIYAHVLSGAIRSRVNDGPERVYRAGEGFFEEPGSRHQVSANASGSEAASLLAVFVLDEHDDVLTLPDPKP
ncbi:cupin domain-containing protein [Enterovirga sp. CN4-39]|uniref:cupin domain-containing protein n=1 Tax=Enterovirga sp. CN4-39 TaxID=3400910 RepID=UPI003C06B606